MITISLRKIAHIGLILMAISIVFGISETIYFGSNMLPRSKAELLCDCIAGGLNLIGCALFVLALWIGVNRRAKELLEQLKSEYHERQNQH